mmetsp:Transcript_14526/g.31606  ORF Transcript_14526/g.31606 Transcript_14526/m.31606 type:complete len:240 (+) Transcript_14526:59-778(+)|eukprot:CAMPEP_0202893938 /NCGR_PEP_ID=MMETSP1392-20130828/3421_1 /ASSEMBLY_ACC=CAM_ASM_000868 /TAXON_ID=225041 /ORGANISM="Chlamydomonas chlamydogama, Strain SAG 11-48b" /LENGTH=239 /DNA_ID=CAMNT_0049578445 /DNA_START=59 /DNA_END=778 /DNA_ORIENTATION=-
MIASSSAPSFRTRPCRGALPRRALGVCNSVRARWCIDVRYGCKQEATTLLQEWVKEIGSQAGLSSSNTRLSSGAIGIPESRLELEVSFSSFAEWEQFLGRIPFKDHKAWSQRIQAMVVNDGSPKWEVYRVVPLDLDQSAAPATASASSATTSATATPLLLPFLKGASSSTANPPVRPNVEVPTLNLQPTATDTSSTSVDDGMASGLTVIDSEAAAEAVLDWKGEPMKINPGDKLPFKFL